MDELIKMLESDLRSLVSRIQYSEDNIESLKRQTESEVTERNRMVLLKGQIEENLRALKWQTNELH